jgi:hypothetical protein
MQLELATLHLVVSPNGQHAARIEVPMLTTVNELHFIPIKTTHSPLLDRRSIAMHVLSLHGEFYRLMLKGPHWKQIRARLMSNFSGVLLVCALEKNTLVLNENQPRKAAISENIVVVVPHAIMVQIIQTSCPQLRTFHAQSSPCPSSIVLNELQVLPEEISQAIRKNWGMTWCWVQRAGAFKTSHRINGENHSNKEDGSRM